LHGQLECVYALDLGVGVVQRRLHEHTQAEEDVLAAAVEADDGSLELRAVQLLRFGLCTEEERGGVQFVQIERLGQLERLLPEVIVDLVFVVSECDLAWEGKPWLVETDEVRRSGRGALT
jgi:hypothetical protein